MFSSTWFSKACCILVCVSSLMACQPVVEFKNTDVTGSTIQADFNLLDHTGKPQRMADFKGKVVAIFFGFTQCPDVCPSALSEWAQILQTLDAEQPPLGDQVQVLFVTLDPERDTPALLAQYVPAFDKRFLGLRGDLQATQKLAQGMKVFYQKIPGSKPGSYTIDHTAGSYLFDTSGQVRVFAKHGNPAALLADVKTLLAK